MKPTSDNVKTALRLELDFTEHDEFITRLIKQAHRSIERNYYCRLLETEQELAEIPDIQRAFLIDDDIELAIQMMAAHWYLNPTGMSSETPSDIGVSYLLFPLEEHTV